jgi:hypothetical protein
MHETDGAGYFVVTVSYMRKMFINLTTGVNPKKTLSLSL